MEGYLSEKEQVQKIKGWWKKYGTTILVCVIIFFAANIGWRYWKSHKIKRAAYASIVYDQMLSADFMHKVDNTKLFANYLMKDYADTPYASLAALTLAKENVNANKLKKAQNNLQWVIDNSDSNSLKQIARIRKARVLLAEKQPKKALQTLQKVNDKAYTSLVTEVKGDIFFSMGDKANALKEYEKALHTRTENGVKEVILAAKINFLTR